jgi:hypothetical protein
MSCSANSVHFESATFHLFFKFIYSLATTLPAAYSEKVLFQINSHFFSDPVMA